MMTKAGKIILTICLTTTALTLNGCVFNSDDSAVNSEQKSEIRSLQNAEQKSVEELLADNALPKSEKPLKLRDLTESKILADGSQYVQMKDAEGNKIESRFFPDGSIVRSLIVKTAADGITKTFVRSWNGKVEQIDADGVATPWSSSARELALIAGFKQEPPPNYERAVTSPAVPVKPQNQAPNSNVAQPPVEISDTATPPVNTTEKK